MQVSVIQCLNSMSQIHSLCLCASLMAFVMFLDIVQAWGHPLLPCMLLKSTTGKKHRFFCASSRSGEEDQAAQNSTMICEHS